MGREPEGERCLKKPQIRMHIHKSTGRLLRNDRPEAGEEGTGSSGEAGKRADPGAAETNAH